MADQHFSVDQTPLTWWALRVFVPLDLLFRLFVWVSGLVCRLAPIDRTLVQARSCAASGGERAAVLRRFLALGRRAPRITTDPQTWLGATLMTAAVVAASALGDVTSAPRVPIFQRDEIFRLELPTGPPANGTRGEEQSPT